MALDLLTTIELDMQNPYSSSSIVHVNQYDTAGRIKAQLLNGGVKWQVPQGAKPVVMFKKTDNIGGFYDVTELNPSTAAVTVDGSDSSIIYITLDQQTTTTATPTGQYVNMQVAFYQNSARLSTFAFHMQVAESVVTSGDIHSNWLFNILSQEIAQILTDATTPEFISQWLENNITQETGYVIDDSLTIHGAASDAQATGKMVTVSDTNPGITANKVWVKKTPSEIVVPTEDEVEDLRNTLSDNNNGILLERTVAIEVAESGKFIDHNGNIQTYAPTAYSKPIRVNKNDVILATMNSGTLMSAITLCDEDGNSKTQVVAGDNDGATPKTYKYVCTDAGYFILSFYTNLSTPACIIETQTIVNIKDDITEINSMVGQTTEYFTSRNMFDGEYLDGYRAGNTVVADNTLCYTKPIFIKAGSYLFTSTESEFGAVTGNSIWIVDKNGQNKRRVLCTSVGTKSETGIWENRKINVFTVDSDCYVSFNIGYKTSNVVYADKPTNFLATAGDSIDDINLYAPYAPSIYTIRGNNINGLSGLKFKKSIFDGDSICRGDSAWSDEDNRTWGYAGRIGRANFMDWHNYGIGGGTITSASNPALTGKHSVVDTIDTMYTDYPDADYIVFEGGTNDADLLGDAIADPSVLGTFTANDYSGTYDNTTFSGALETIFFKATEYWKGKHIGYIVAHKMGIYSAYDAEHSNRRAYFARAIEICKKWGIPYLDLWNNCYLNPKNPNLWDSNANIHDNVIGGYLYIDGQHLSNKGYDYISPIIEDWMKSI